ncbi:hypothetical protein PF008_g24020 [Phytophthora fragariae]|uniref:Uncharacterized protein n=1 Tax=Phytophthora fragariae TaxID=53985 RepID=A0A6G0QP38_9STRA|nr:hypothetical protein PF008_g24020 [Phytophthora fragariae]
MDRVDEHPATYDSAFEPSDAMEEDEDDDWEVKGTVTEAAEAAVVSAGRSSGIRPLARNLVDELDDVAKPEPAFGEDDGEDGAKDFRRRPQPRSSRRESVRHSTETRWRPIRCWAGV